MSPNSNFPPELTPLHTNGSASRDQEYRRQNLTSKKKLAPEVRQVIVLAVLAVLIFAGFQIYFTASRLHLSEQLGSENPYFRPDLVYDGYNGFAALDDSKTPLLNQVVDFEALYAEMTGSTKKAVAEQGIFAADPDADGYRPKSRSGKLFYDCFRLETGKDAPSTSLKNGDLIPVVLHIDTSTLNGLSMVTHKVSDKETLELNYKVAGLKDPMAVINPFGGIEKLIVDNTNNNSIMVFQSEEYSEVFGSYVVTYKESPAVGATGLILTNGNGQDVNALSFASDKYKNDRNITLRANVLREDGVERHDTYLELEDGVILYPLSKTFQAGIWYCLTTDPSETTPQLLRPLYDKSLDAAREAVGSGAMIEKCYLIVYPESGTSDIYYAAKYLDGSTEQYAMITVHGVKVDENYQLADTDSYTYDVVSGLSDIAAIESGLQATIAEYKEDYDAELDLTELPIE